MNDEYNPADDPRDPLPADEQEDLGSEACIEHHGSGVECEGITVYRMPLSGTGIPYPRCERHWSERLDREDQLRRDYPDSPIPPAWFDPTYAGEHWDDDY